MVLRERWFVLQEELRFTRFLDVSFLVGCFYCSEFICVFCFRDVLFLGEGGFYELVLFEGKLVKLGRDFEKEGDFGQYEFSKV